MLPVIMHTIGIVSILFTVILIADVVLNPYDRRGYKSSVLFAPIGMIFYIVWLVIG